MIALVGGRIVPRSDDQTTTCAKHRAEGEAPPIKTEDVFRSLIADELRNGRLSAARRRRIVRYAAAMGLNATEAGEVISECRIVALSDPDPHIRRHAMRLVHPDPPLIPAGLKLALAVIVAVALDALLVAVFGD